MAQVNPTYNVMEVVRCPLPDLCSDGEFRTKHPASSPFRLAREQLVNWPDFEKTVRESTKAYLGLGTHIIPTQEQKELVRVGNEGGLMGRFGQNVAHVATEANNECGLPIYYGDYQTGRATGRVSGFGGLPDLVLTDSEHEIRVVCEGKTFWTVNLVECSDEERAILLGQLARYMDDHHVAFGCYTTYNHSIFLKRVSDTTFRESPVILHTTASTVIGGEGGVSVRECFLYLAIVASTDSYYYPTRIGHTLTNKFFTQRGRSSPRLGTKPEELETGLKSLSLKDKDSK